MTTHESRAREFIDGIDIDALLPGRRDDATDDTVASLTALLDTVAKEAGEASATVVDAARALVLWDWLRMLPDDEAADEVRNDIERLTEALSALAEEGGSDV